MNPWVELMKGELCFALFRYSEQLNIIIYSVVVQWMLCFIKLTELRKNMGNQRHIALVGISRHTACKVTNGDIFNSGADIHRRLLSKKPTDAAVLDPGLFSTEYKGSWGVLMDKGYEVLLVVVLTFHLKKRPARGHHLQEVLLYNTKVRSD